MNLAGIAAYHPDPIYRLRWEQMRPELLPPPYQQYWIASVRGVQVGELFQGKSGVWFGLVYGRYTLWRPNVRWVALAMVATVLGPRA